MKKETDVTDQSHCGQPRSATNGHIKQKVDAVIKEDCRVRVRKTAAQHNIGHLIINR